MKKLFTLLCTFAFALGINAYDVVVDEMCFDLNKENKTATFVQDPNYVYQYLGDIVIPEKISVDNVEYTVTGIGEYAFFYTKGLTSVSFPESIETIGTYAFSYSAITEINVPSKVKVLEPYVFSDCNELEKVTLPEGLEEIKAYAFYACKTLKSITLPSTLKTISEKSEWIFNLCGKLTEIHANMTEPMAIPISTFDQDTFDYATLYVPMGCKAKYQETMYWDMFVNIVEEEVQTPTGISSASVENKQDGAIYDIQGRRANADTKGIVIQNGKKFIKK